MCSGPRKPLPPPSPPTGPAAMGAGGDPEKLPAVASLASLLLELSASDDLPAFKRAVEDDGLPLDSPAPWYCRSPGRRTMGFEQRTPLMIAALYGSPAVLAYILSIRPAEASRCSPSDGTTPLHCAASGGSPSSLGIVKMLVDAAADVDAPDAAGNRPGDVIARQFSASTARSLEVVLKASCPGVSSPGGAKEEETKSGEKKYPLDITLPDINNGIYGTDEFRMYTFKVKPCSRAYSHDWTECPFVHPGENARRRDPRKYLYSCVPCPEFRKGSCRKGDACEYAHGVFESWLHPAQYRTRLCKDETGCNRRVCFFAHKPEELRSVNPSAASVAGMMLSSPKSSSPGLSSLDMATALMMMQQTGSAMSPSASSGLGAATGWMNQPGSLATPPSLQLPSSRLKAPLSARDLSFDLDLLGLEGYRQNLIDEFSSTASPRANWTPNSLSAVAAASRASDINELFGSLDPSVLSQLQGLPPKKTATASSSAGAQFQSPTGVRSQLLSGYGGNLPSSPTVSATSSFGLDHSMAKAIMSSRASAFAKRSQSFIDRGATAGRQSTLSSMTTAAAAAASFSDWGSPDGKLDWGVQGEELNKLRKSASLNFRTNQAGSGFGGAAPASAAVPGGMDEPDLSWVQSLVKDGPAAPMGRHGLEQQQKRYQLNAAGGDFHGSELPSSWEGKIMA
ncbi:zinc finger CCCH domain-containing protein 33 [Phoenix dactylifera]|uniref:Zinc finger CCCH domain-containing protein 33 n=1 Tax=Phoenix dactylifera TaxID=42345 RepID=A0A8B7C725_PHODC|nr:zinc finger CCCH domain-containing protein 33 [Phoenix dactylifera]